MRHHDANTAVGAVPAALYDQSVPLFRRVLVVLSGEETDEHLLRYARMLADLAPALETLCVHISDAGDLLDSILDMTAARGCDLILLGDDHAARRRRSLARRLAMKAPCSVWMVPNGCAPAIGRVLVPIDFSPRSADSLRLAAAITAAAGYDECVALHVYFNHATATFDEFDEILVDSAEQAFGIFVAPIDLHGVFARPMFVEAPKVAPAILRVAGESQSDLIVMGTRGRSRSAAVLLGSETEHVLMSSAVPVLAVKHFGARRRLLQVLRDERVRRRGGEEGYI